LTLKKNIAIQIELYIEDVSNHGIMRNGTINHTPLYPDNTDTAGKAILLNVNPDFLRFAGNKISMILKCATQITGASAEFYGGSDLNLAPRLVVSYTKTNGNENIDWSSSHFNSQHSGKTYMVLKGEHASGLGSLRPKPISANPGFTKINVDMLMYKGLIYLVDNGFDNGSNTVVYSVDPLTSAQSKVIPSLFPVKATPVIDPSGYMYCVTSGGIYVFDINNGFAQKNVIANNVGDMASAPTTGADGSLYIASKDSVYAYSPYPQNSLIWKYRTAGRNGSVALSKNGKIAYVVSYDKGGVTGSVIGLSTTDGSVLFASRQLSLSMSQDVGPTMPVIAGNNGVYVANSLQDADTMYIFDDSLHLLQATGGAGISLPAAGQADTIFFIRDGALVKSFIINSNGQSKVINDIVTSWFFPAGARSVVGDFSGNVYCLGKDDIVYEWFAGLSSTSATSMPVAPGTAKNAMIIGPDGSLYITNQTSLNAIRPNLSGQDIVTVSDPGNNETYCGGTIYVSDSTQVSHHNILVGTSNVTFGNNAKIATGATTMVETGGTISFQNGFIVKQGAQLSCKTGY